MMRKLLVALAISLLALGASKAGTERVDLRPVTKGLVFSNDATGTWHSRVGLIHEFSDAIIYACFEFPVQTEVECLVITKDTGETLMMPLRLLEIKT